jgi:hypothetical protein
MDERAEEILVARDPERASVELRIGGPEVDPLVFRLTAEEARRVAALILFQAARLHRAVGEPVAAPGGFLWGGRSQGSGGPPPMR